MLLSREPRIVAFFDILGNNRIPTQQKQHRLRYPSLVLGVEYYKVMSNTFRSIVRACLPTTATTSHLRTRRPLGERPTAITFQWQRRFAAAAHSSYRTTNVSSLIPSSSSTSTMKTTTTTTTSQVSCYFHSSSFPNTPVRRRRRSPTSSGGSGTTSRQDEDSEELRNRSPLAHAPIDDDVEFVQAAVALLDRLEAGLEPMKAPVNDFFKVERFFGDLGEVLTIDLGPKDGKYRVAMSLDDHVFEYSSPISGKILYILSADTGEWVGIEDGHSFEGLLVRDLIRQCRGMPKL